MAESQDWRQRLADARARTVFEPTPTGATAHVVTLEYLAERLDEIEVARSAAAPSSTAALLASALAVLLREAINARMYAQMMRARVDTQPDRVDRLCDLLDVLLTRMEPTPRA